MVADTPRSGSARRPAARRVTFASGMAVTQAAEKVIEELKKRAAHDVGNQVDAVEWKDGKAVPAGSNAGAFDPWTCGAIAAEGRRAPVGRSVPRCRLTHKAPGRVSASTSAT